MYGEFISFEVILTIVIPCLLFVSALIFISKQYVRCPSNKVLVKFGKVRGGQTSETYHGGGTFIVPLIQGYSFLSLEPVSNVGDVTATIPDQGLCQVGKRKHA